MSQQPPVQPPPKSERSRRVKTSDEALEGEALAQCSDKEWEQSESAYSADLLNVKKKPNRVTVFAAPEKTADAAARSLRQMPVVIREVQPPTESDERVRGLNRLVTGVAKILLKEDAAGVEVTVSLKINRQEKQEIK